MFPSEFTRAIPAAAAAPPRKEAGSVQKDAYEVDAPAAASVSPIKARTVLTVDATVRANPIAQMTAGVVAQWALPTSPPSTCKTRSLTAAACSISQNTSGSRRLPRISSFFAAGTARTPDGGDYTVGVKFGYANENYYILDMYLVQLDFAGVIRLITHKIAVDQPAWRIIETADGSGDAAYRILTQEYGIRNISPVCPRKSKEDRFYEIVPMIEGGDVYIPTSASWLQEYRNEFIAFPNNAPGHDDMLDAVSQFLRHANELVRKAGGIRPTKYFCDTLVYRMASFGPKRLVRYS